jgi:phosphate starvation-inducible protein PhoH and related proteins
VIKKHTLAPADNRRLAHLCGPLEANLRQIELALGLRLSRREAAFRLEGPKAACESAAQLLDQLYARARSPLLASELQLALVQVLAQARAQAQEPSAAPQPALRPYRPEPAAATGPAVVLHTRHTELTGRTPNQVQYLQQMLAHDITLGLGPAGTGKTFLAVACAVDALERKSVERIVLTRPAVEAGERLGFLPGDLAQKVDPYLRPLYDALYDLMGFDRVNRAFEKGQIEIAPLAFMRGRTLSHAFVILDEAQNTTREQMKMFLTRIGFGSRCVVNGDVSQIDLPQGMQSGLVQAQAILQGVNGIAFTEFTAADVVRHPLVARIVKAYERAAEPAAAPRVGRPRLRPSPA